MDQTGQASRTGKNGQEQLQVDGALQHGLPVITDNRNEVSIFHRQRQNSLLLCDDTEQRPHASDRTNVLDRTVEMSPQDITTAITGTTGFQTMTSNGTTVLPREHQSTQVDTGTINVDRNINSFIDQTQSYSSRLPEQLYQQQFQYWETAMQSHQNAQELAHLLLFSLQHQQEDAPISHLPQEGRINIVGDESDIHSASATPTDSYGENNSPTNSDGQDESLPTTLQSDGDYLSDNESGGSSSQGGHERRDTGKRYYCPDCPLSHSGFARERDMRRHIRTIHNRESHICRICGNRYWRRDTLKRHLRDSHDQ